MYHKEDPFYDDVQKFVKQSDFSANPVLCEHSAASQSNSRRSFLMSQLKFTTGLLLDGRCSGYVGFAPLNPLNARASRLCACHARLS